MFWDQNSILISVRDALESRSSLQASSSRGPCGVESLGAILCVCLGEMTPVDCVATELAPKAKF